MIIGLYSSSPGQGKSEVAKVLRNLGYDVRPFAQPMRKLLIAFLVLAGVSRERGTRYLYYAKEEVIPELGVTARHLLRTLGTDWGRKMVGEDVWVNMWLHGVNEKTVADDLRMPNEFSLIQDLSGQCWRIVRPGYEVPPEHASDGALETADFDRTIINDGSILDLQRKVMDYAL